MSSHALIFNEFVVVMFAYSASSMVFFSMDIDPQEISIIFDI